MGRQIERESNIWAENLILGRKSCNGQINCKRIKLLGRKSLGRTFLRKNTFWAENLAAANFLPKKYTQKCTV
jgi:hypothetical protein